MKRPRSAYRLILLMSVCLGAIAAPNLHAGADLRPYETTGTVLAILPGDGFIVIDHDPIEAPGFFMARMEMPFSVADPAVLNGLKVGDRIRFRVSEEKKSRIIALQKLPK